MYGLGTAESINETYQIERTPGEPVELFHTRVANELQTMNVKIVGAYFSDDLCTFWYHEHISNY